MVARTLTTWPLGADGPVAVQGTNPSKSLGLHVGLKIGKLPSVAVLFYAQLHVHAVGAHHLKYGPKL